MTLDQQLIWAETIVTLSQTLATGNGCRTGTGTHADLSLVSVCKRRHGLVSVSVTAASGY